MQNINDEGKEKNEELKLTENSEHQVMDEEYEEDCYSDDYFDSEDENEPPAHIIWNLSYQRLYHPDQINLHMFGTTQPTLEMQEKSFSQLFSTFFTNNNNSKLKKEELDSNFLLTSMALFSKRCQICKKDEGTKFCQACKTIYYCGPEHQKQNWSEHKLKCPLLKKRADDLLFLKNPMPPNLELSNQKIQTNYKFIKNWDEYFQLRPLAIEYQNEVSKNSSFRRCLTDVLHISLTLYYILNQLKYIENRSKVTNTKILIHIIGSEDATEIDLPNLRYHELMFLIPESIELTLIFIGPNMSKRNDHLYQTFFKNRLTIASFKVDYITYLTKINKTQVPNLVVSFNGQSHQSNWSQVLNFLMKINVPTCFTSPDNEDFELSQRIITNNYGLKIIHASKNPFSSERYCIDPWSPHLIYCPSQFIYAFQGKKDIL